MATIEIGRRPAGARIGLWPLTLEALTLDERREVLSQALQDELVAGCYEVLAEPREPVGLEHLRVPTLVETEIGSLDRRELGQLLAHGLSIARESEANGGTADASAQLAIACLARALSDPRVGDSQESGAELEISEGQVEVCCAFSPVEQGVCALAAVLAAQGQRPQAIEWLQWIAGCRNFDMAKTLLTSHLIEAGRARDALTETDGVVPTDTNAGVLVLLRSEALQQTGMLDEARLAVDRVAKTQRDIPWLARSARTRRTALLIEAGEIVRAEAELAALRSEASQQPYLESLAEKIRQSRTQATQRIGLARDLRRAVYDRDGGKCRECGSGFELQYDHVIPLSRGGANSLDNLQLLCGNCNRRKGASIA